MRALFIDLASSKKIFALVTDKKTLCSAEIDDRTGEELLLSVIESLLKKSGWKFDDLTHIAAITGPGGFMSLRVAISLANALSWSLKIPIAGIHLSDLWASRLLSPNPDSFLWLHSTKKNLLFVRGFGKFAKAWPEPVCITIDEFEAKSRKLPVQTDNRPGGRVSGYVGELIEEHKEVLKQLKPLTPILPVEKVLSKLLTDCTWKNEILNPWYGRSG